MTIQKQNKRCLEDIDWLCTYLSIKPSRARTAIFKREIPVIRIGNLIRFDPAEIEKWIENKKAK